MARKRLIRSQIFPYHVTLRANNREAFKLPLDTVWSLTADEIYRISILGDVRTHAFVLMPNHLHLLLSTPQWDLGKAMEEFGKSLTQTYNRLSGRSGHLFGGPYYWSIIQGPLHYGCVFKYIYRNPARAKLVERVETYSYSSLHGLVGKAHLPFPLHFPEVERLNFSYIPEDLDEMLTWLNTPFLKEEQEAIGKGLRRRIFKLPRDPQTGKSLPLKSIVETNQ